MPFEWRKLPQLSGDYTEATEDEREERFQRSMTEVDVRREAENNPYYRRLRFKSRFFTVASLAIIWALVYVYSIEHNKLRCYEASRNLHQARLCEQNAD